MLYLPCNSAFYQEAKLFPCTHYVERTNCDEIWTDLNINKPPPDDYSSLGNRDL